MKPKVKDAVDCTIEALREGLRALYKGAMPEILTDEFWLAIDEQVRLEVGGTSDYIKKTPQRAEVRKTQAVQDFARGAPARQAAGSNGISRASIYRALNQKTGGAGKG